MSGWSRQGPGERKGGEPSPSDGGSGGVAGLSCRRFGTILIAKAKGAPVFLGLPSPWFLGS